MPPSDRSLATARGLLNATPGVYYHDACYEGAVLTIAEALDAAARSCPQCGAIPGGEGNTFQCKKLSWQECGLHRADAARMPSREAMIKSIRSVRVRLGFYNDNIVPEEWAASIADAILKSAEEGEGR